MYESVFVGFLIIIVISTSFTLSVDKLICFIIVYTIVLKFSYPSHKYFPINLPESAAENFRKNFYNNHKLTKCCRIGSAGNNLIY